jgi:hypothetical protein
MDRKMLITPVRSAMKAIWPGDKETLPNCPRGATGPFTT